MIENTDLIPIIVSDNQPDNSKNMFPTAKQLVGKISEVQIGALQESIKDIFDKTLTVFDEVDIHTQNHKYEIDSVTIHLNISNGGKVSLVGEVSSGVTSGLTIVLKSKRR